MAEGGENLFAAILILTKMFGVLAHIFQHKWPMPPAFTRNRKNFSMVIIAKRILTLFKLRIGFAMILTTGMGIMISDGLPLTTGQVVLLLTAVLVSSSAAGALNHYVDWNIDRNMSRTKDRPFATGSLPHSKLWLLMVVVMTLASTYAVYYHINPQSALFLFLGAFFYGVVYTVWLKRRTWMNVVIGGLAGSCAVLVGCTAIDPVLTKLSLSLALVMFLWTPSHFWSLAIVYRKDYMACKIPMLPALIGKRGAARVVLFNAILLVLASFLPFAFGLGWLYLIGAVVGGGWFLVNSLKLALKPGNQTAMVNFRTSLAHLGLLLVTASLDAQLAI